MRCTNVANLDFHLALQLWKEEPEDAEKTQIARALIADLEGHSGETLARQAIHMAHAVIEGPYQSMLRKVVASRLLSRNDLRNPAGELGNLVPQALSILQDYPQIVDPDAAHIRNAPAHANWRYDPSSGLLTLKDRDKFTMILTVDEWLKKVASLYQLSSRTFPRVHQLLIVRHLQHVTFPNYFAQAFEALRRKDVEWLQTIIQAAVGSDGLAGVAADRIRQRDLLHPKTKLPKTPT